MYNNISLLEIVKNLPKIIDNDRKSLKEIFDSLLPEYKHLSIATGYIDLEGIIEVQDQLDHYDSIRILIGREPMLPRHKLEEPEDDFPELDIFTDLENLAPDNKYKIAIIKLKEHIQSGKIQIKIYKKSFLHAKCYIFGNYESDTAVGIIGSSNFTKAGLTKNTELNSLENDHRIVTFKPQTDTQEVGHLFWFDKFWEESEDWNGKFTEIISHSPVGDTLFTPYETYIKTLYELYKEELEDIELDESIKGEFDLMEFQYKNAQALVRRLNKYKIAMLADSVGLGKTITAIQVIKNYCPQGESNRIEIICPKALVNQWQNELATQGLTNIKPLTLQNPKEIESRIKIDQYASVKLFVIDESHNLKNSSGKRYQMIIEWMRKNPNAHVLLLTATPISNQLSDISNQILLGTRGETSTVTVTGKDRSTGVTRELTFHDAIENVQKKINQTASKTGVINPEDYDEIRQVMTPILRHFVVRRTRQGIEAEYGGLTIKGKTTYFPTVIPEVKKYEFNDTIFSEMLKVESKNLDLENIYSLPINEIIEHTKNLKHPLQQIDTISNYIKDIRKESSPIYIIYQIILLLGFVPYRWQMYKTKYHGKTREQLKSLVGNAEERKSLLMQLSIYGILRTIFLKRLESSVSAIRTSLQTYKAKLTIFEKGVHDNKIISLKDIQEIEKSLGIFDDETNIDIEAQIQEEVLDEIDDNNYNKEELIEDIKNEKTLIDILDKHLAILENDDSKIQSFIELLNNIENTKPAGEKVLIFSYYADTIDYLEKTLPKYTNLISTENTGFISSKTRNNAENLAERFSPVSKKYTLKEDETELKYLFSTDVLSEGQNLQDCGILINFDLHWSPTRMIQRNGRVNRLGTSFDKVYIYNIAPENQLEEYLKLVQKLEGKINIIRNTIGTDTPVLSEEANPIEFSDKLKDIYSQDEQSRIKALIESEKEADFLLSEDEFVNDLKWFNSNPEIDINYKKQIFNIPLGKWCLMPQSINRGTDRAQILTLSELININNEVTNHRFAKINRDGDKFNIIPQLQALEWLKTEYQRDQRREADKISLNKAEICETLEKRLKTASTNDSFDPESYTPTKQELEVLRIMYELHHTQEEIDTVRKSYATTNQIDYKRIRQLVKTIAKNKKDNKISTNEIKEIVSIASKTFLHRKEQLEHHSTRQILFYSSING